MKSLTGHIAFIKSTNEFGLILGKINENNTGWKVQFSFDTKVLVERLNLSDIVIGEQKGLETILERLVRDINSEDLQTRQWTSEILCYFIEENGSEIDFDTLKSSVPKLVERISLEDDWDVGQKLSEGIFEFIYLQKLDKKSEFELVTKLATLDKDYLHTYLDDEEYLDIKEVKEFITDKTKWWNAGS